MRDYLDLKFHTIRPHNSYLVSQLRWAEKYLKSYLLNNSISFWYFCPKLYQRLDKIYNWIMENAIQELIINGK